MLMEKIHIFTRGHYFNIISYLQHYLLNLLIQSYVHGPCNKLMSYNNVEGKQDANLSNFYKVPELKFDNSMLLNLEGEKESRYIGRNILRHSFEVLRE